MRFSVCLPACLSVCLSVCPTPPVAPGRAVLPVLPVLRPVARGPGLGAPRSRAGRWGAVAAEGEEEAEAEEEEELEEEEEEQEQQQDVRMKQTRPSQAGTHRAPGVSGGKLRGALAPRSAPRCTPPYATEEMACRWIRQGCIISLSAVSAALCAAFRWREGGCLQLL